MTFGSKSAPSFKINSETSIEATAPAGEGTSDLTVTSPAGSNALCWGDHFGNVPAPTVTALSAKVGSVTGGEVERIEGANLDEVSAVKFGSASATEVRVEYRNDKPHETPYIFARTPPGVVGKVDVTVVAAGGTSALTRIDRFTYAPTITSVSPSSGPTSGGTAVTVKGTGFATAGGATVFKFGSVAASGVSCASSSECTMVAPAHAAGRVDVRATVNKVTSPAAATERFTYS